MICGQNGDNAERDKSPAGSDVHDNMKNMTTPNPGEGWREGGWSVTSGDEMSLRIVETDTAYGSFMLFEPVDKNAHTVIPLLGHPAVQARQDPWPLTVETKSLHPVALRFELGRSSSSPLPAPHLHR